MHSMEKLWQVYLENGGEASSTAFGVWLIREQPSLEVPHSATVEPMHDDLNGTRDSLKISFRADGSPAGYMGMDISVRASIMIGRLQRFAHFLTKSGMKESGMTEDEFVVLATLLYLPQVSKTQLLKQCLIEIPTGSELLKRMKKAGQVLEKKNPEDGRSSFISISARGRQQLFKTFHSLAGVEDALSPLTMHEKETLMQLLDKLDLYHSRRHEIRQVRELMQEQPGG